MHPHELAGGDERNVSGLRSRLRQPGVSMWTRPAVLLGCVRGHRRSVTFVFRWSPTERCDRGSSRARPAGGIDGRGVRWGRVQRWAAFSCRSPMAPTGRGRGGPFRGIVHYVRFVRSIVSRGDFNFGQNLT